jgi:hypothetical protein
MLELCRRAYRCSFCQRDSIFVYVNECTGNLALQAHCPACRCVTHSAVDTEALFADGHQGNEKHRAAAVGGYA